MYSSYRRLGAVVIVPPHHLDTISARHLETAARDAATDGTVYRIIIDLRSNRYVDSFGLSALVAIRKRFAHRMTTVVPKRSGLYRLLVITGLVKVLDVSETLLEAFANTAQGAGPISRTSVN